MFIKGEIYSQWSALFKVFTETQTFSLANEKNLFGESLMHFLKWPYCFATHLQLIRLYFHNHFKLLTLPDGNKDR